MHFQASWPCLLPLPHATFKACNPLWSVLDAMCKQRSLHAVSHCCSSCSPQATPRCPTACRSITRAASTSRTPPVPPFVSFLRRHAAYFLFFDALFQLYCCAEGGAVVCRRLRVMKLRACSEGPMEVLCGGMGARRGGCSHKAMKMSFINTRNLFASNVIKRFTPKRRTPTKI